ncbi:glycosyltransferase family 2 protein [Paenibacillus sp. QZ-Y1]|uniref:glycosyltransferase family 2 protein n=1 Tax=Paenibacillus sp. QZ-Y1 TaxID=3414511 RepID=UPI003F78DC13
MNIVITMGGMGSRFFKAGYTLPKYMIEVKNKTLFEWSIISLRNFKIDNNKFIFIVKKEDNAVEFILEKCKYIGIDMPDIIEIGALTDGQATTAMLAKEYWNADEALIVYNIDTHIDPDALNPEDIQGDGWIPTFNGEGESWSFVKINEFGDGTEVREKQRISDYATIGLYAFSSALLYEKLYTQYYSNQDNIEKGEKYIAPIYNQLIENGGRVRIKQLPREAVQVIGTPEELIEFKNNYYSI